MRCCETAEVQGGTQPVASRPLPISSAGWGVDEARQRILRELPNSAVFGARFRMNASRALLLPRARGRKRTPFWLQRLKARDLMAAVRNQPDFPIIAETYRDCLRDVMDLEHLNEVLRGIRGRAHPRDCGRDDCRRRRWPRACCMRLSARTCTSGTRPRPSGSCRSWR
jgi:hypothetical protein